jgi:alkylation response protein AidB-like acyl-CoA dehydrogenase
MLAGSTSKRPPRPPNGDRRVTFDATELVEAALDPAADTDERRALRETIRRVVAEVSPPDRVQELDEASEYDVSLHRALGRIGLLELGGPRGIGGAGDVRDQVAVIEELAAGPTTVAAMFITQYIATQLLGASSVADHQDAVRAVMSGEAFLSFALSEADGGTDVARVMKTRATRVDGGYVINGEKMWTSGVRHASHVIVLARTGGWERSPLDGITTFVVPRDADGLTVSSIDTLGLRGLSTSVLAFSDVFVPDEHIVGAVDQGFRSVFPTLNRERVNSAAALLGIARGALVLARSYAQSREAFGRPIGSFQTLQHRLVDGFVGYEEARGVLHRAAEVEAGGGRSEFLAAMAKLSASRVAQQVTQDGMQLMAGAGFSRASAMQRWFRDARLWTFAPASDEVLRNGLGERMLDLPRSF